MSLLKLLHHKKRLIGCSILLVTSALTFCAQGNEFKRHVDNPFFNQRMVYCANDVIHTFNPQRAARGITVDIIGPQIYNRLLRTDDDALTLVPELADTWEVNEDYTRFIFTLKKGIPFHSSKLFTPTRNLTAQDVKFSFDRLINQKNPFYHVDYFPYFEAIGLKSRIKSIDVLDEHRIEFTLHHPDVTFLSHLASYFAPVLSKEYAETLLKLGKPELLDKDPIGTGAFQLVGYLVDEQVRLKKFDNSWQRKDESEHTFEQVIFELSSSGVGRLAKLLSDECDLLAYPAAAQLSKVDDETRLNHLERSTFGTAFLAFNTQQPPLDNPKVRSAIAFAINNPRLMRSIYRDSAETASAFLPSYHWAFDPQVQITHYSPKASKQILKSLGIEDLTLTLRVSSNPQPYNPSPIKMAELIQADLAQIGISLKIIVHDGLTTASYYDSHKVDLELTGWSAPNAEPDSYLRPVLSCAAISARTNNSFWCNEEFDSLLDKALLVDDKMARKLLYQKAQKILFEKLPILPIAYSKNMVIYDTNIKNSQSLTHGNFSFYRLERISEDDSE
ncbi:ABC transporter substrate-binding protein SapA [Thorsellia kenyensis]|uniref:ABC transporter substrate-binding protein SapA n=1 Tax=Thorsellia kenyensis TaxID=1549888 RepID=A0ABV6CCT8_9GAMM